MLGHEASYGHLDIGNAQTQPALSLVAQQHPRGEATIRHILIVVHHSHDDTFDRIIPGIWQQASPDVTTHRSSAARVKGHVSLIKAALVVDKHIPSSCDLCSRCMDDTYIELQVCHAMNVVKSSLHCLVAVTSSREYTSAAEAMAHMPNGT